jgi:hypothetical protein
MSAEISEQTGVEPFLEEEDIRGYLAEVIKGTRITNKKLLATANTLLSCVIILLI